MKVDLHCHTTASDGSLTPKEIIDLALEHEIELLSITDHDTTAGYESIKRYALERGIQLISGAEISCLWNNHTIHIVGLNFDVDNPTLQSGLEGIRQQRLLRSTQILEKLKQHPNIEIDDIEQQLNKIVGVGIVGRGHFAELLIRHGYVKNGQQAFNKYLKKGKPAYAPSQWPELNQVVKWINQAGGVAVIAHPGIYKLTSRKLNRLISDFKLAGGQAIEVVNQPRHSADIIGMAERANNHKLYASIGSDFHTPAHTWRGLGWLAPLPQNAQPVWHLFE